MGDHQARTDEALVRQVGTGDLEALGTLFSRHHARVFALCLRLVSDEAAAQDLAQETFLRVLKYGRGFDGRSRFSTWLYRIARNVCLDHLARLDRERRRDERAALAHQAHTDSSDQDPRVACLQEALTRLAPDKREVLILSRFEDLKYREIAEICDVTVDTIKTRAHRAMRELRRIVDQLEGES